ncbi:hypothetical protein OC846_005755 [Tilletia horrida]|uniref:F-box domain-containing protein n=1 Tax=Tilletia horrida TaxID=155126 RepID=A0AAN6GKN7_9BASI|nr:hypothetical protein OC845_005716 [Tilletia horrida]KAK0545226.1 hypothetical protein OC846_005755 [Tilletia horrida]KAK0564885.1 hypothetical protein OC861_004062 [Tilletia horrida]
MPPKKNSRSKRKREAHLLDLPNEILVCILQWCDTLTAYKLGCANKRLRTVTDHYTFHRKFPLPSVPYLDRPKSTSIQLHPAILHAAWRPALGYDDIQIMMGLRTFDLLGSGVEGQAATDPPVEMCHIHATRVEYRWEHIRFDLNSDCRLLGLVLRPHHFLTVEDVLKGLVSEIERLTPRGHYGRSQVYRVPLQTALDEVGYVHPCLTIALDPRRDLRYARTLDPTGKRFCIRAPAKRLGYSLRSDSADAGPSHS